MKKTLIQAISSEEKPEPIQTIVKNKIRRKMAERKIYSTGEKKEYKWNYFKNKITKDFRTVPWGY